MDLDSLIQFDKELLLKLNGSDSIVLDNIMYLSTKTAVWIPFFLLLVYLILRSNPFKKALLIFAAVGLCIFLTEYITSGLMKPYFHRLRPTQDPSLVAFVDIVKGYRGGRFGFASSHAANTFGLFMLLSLIVKNWKVSLSLLAWASFHTYTRIYLGVHFPGDIITGLVIGLIVGSIVYLIFRKASGIISNTGSLPSYYAAQGGYFPYEVNLLCLVLLLNYLGVVISSFFIS